MLKYILPNAKDPRRVAPQAPRKLLDAHSSNLAVSLMCAGVLTLADKATYNCSTKTNKPEEKKIKMNHTPEKLLIPDASLQHKQGYSV